jgi:hypothetical protein
MNNDHTGIAAEVRASVCGRVTSSGGRLRRFGLACVLVLSAAGAVSAQDRNGFRKDDLQLQRDDRGDRNGRQDAQRSEQRDRADDAHRQQQERNAEVQRRSGRMTPDERRDLRRQINEAGIDLYPNTPRR